MRINHSYALNQGPTEKCQIASCGRVQLKCDGTRRRLGGGSEGETGQYSSHYLGTWCIQHYYRWCAQLGCQQSTELTPLADLIGLDPFGRKTKSGFCACAVIFQLAFTLHQIDVLHNTGLRVKLSVGRLYVLISYGPNIHPKLNCAVSLRKKLHEKLNWMFSGTAQVSHQICQFLM
jgi:hypothetical protein